MRRCQTFSSTLTVSAKDCVLVELPTVLRIPSRTHSGSLTASAGEDAAHEASSANRNCRYRLELDFIAVCLHPNR